MLDAALIMEVLKKATLVGCRLSVHIRTPYGGMDAYATPEQVTACLVDGAHLPAIVTGLLEDEYEEWLELEGRVRCSAVLKSGSQCGNMVTGSPIYEPLAWKAARAAFPYCHVHQG